MESLVSRLVEDLDLEKTEVIRLVGIFLKVSRDDLRTMEEAIARGDAPLLRQHAHNVKGAASNLQIEKARGAAERLETIGKEGRVSDTAPLIAELRSELDRLQAEMVREENAGPSNP